MGFTKNILTNTMLDTYNQLIALQIKFPSHNLLAEEGILI